MFTGLIEELGEVAAVSPVPAGLRISIRTGLTAELALGDSIAVNGVCLTVVGRGKIGFDADISPETARVTNLGQLATRDMVNLERSMRADARVGGHFVLGHVDSTGRVEEIQQEADFFRVSVSLTPTLAPYLVKKGSIAVDGISLTVADLHDTNFDVQIIPFTWSHTSLCRAKVGSVVNLECDIIGKHVVRAFEISAQQLDRMDVSETEDRHD
jgi:riboflavin synthase